MSGTDKQMILESLEAELASVADERENLERREAALAKAVAGMRELISLNGGKQIVVEDKPAVPKNAFARMGISAAAIKYLRLVKKNQKNSELAKALLDGGKKGGGKNFANTLRSVLQYQSKKPNSPIYWTGSEWGLKEWLRPAAHQETEKPT